MKTVYLFYDRGSTRIPRTISSASVYENDNFLHALFTVTGGGIWKADNCEYFFNRRIDAGKLSSLIPDAVIVEVENNSQGTAQLSSVSVTGFFERPWKDDINDEKEIDTSKKEAVFFTEYWKEKLKTELYARKYSQNTISAYIYYNHAMCQWLCKTPDMVTIDDIKKYLAYKEQHDNQSAATLNIALSAFKFFFNYILKSDKIREQKRPRQDKKLPVVLSKSEIKKMIASEKNLKHQLLLMMVYSSGLRVSEVVSLKKHDIDFDRKSMFILSGKGRKDRYTIISEAVIRTLKEYFNKYDIEDWLFPGQPSSRHLNSRSAQHIFEKAMKSAGITKAASIHSLRHSFATHLLESGIDIRYIQDLLGHSTIRTTERYTHVARRKALSIVSPLDTVDDEV